uniref:BAR domain-containing protein n=1 Tax=Hucho hucho TaxID=62062 RepID=A0A4W5MDT7_9TELE
MFSLSRAEKTEVLSDDLLQVEKRLDLVKQVTHSTHKKLTACLQGQQGAEEREKKSKKLPLTILAQCMVEGAAVLGDDSLLGKMLNLCGETEEKLAQELIQFEFQIEKDVVEPLYESFLIIFSRINYQRICIILRLVHFLYQCLYPSDDLDSFYSQIAERVFKPHIFTPLSLCVSLSLCHPLCPTVSLCVPLSPSVSHCLPLFPYVTLCFPVCLCPPLFPCLSDPSLSMCLCRLCPPLCPCVSVPLSLPVSLSHSLSLCLCVSPCSS